MRGWPDEACEGGFWSWDAEAGADEFVERQFQLHAGFGKPQHDVARVAALVADGPAGDFSFRDEGADVVFGSVVLIGISGRSRTRRSPSLLRNSRLSNLSSVAYPVLARLKIRSKRARKSWACFTLGASL